jgi:hypothetical protein
MPPFLLFSVVLYPATLIRKLISFNFL